MEIHVPPNFPALRCVHWMNTDCFCIFCEKRDFSWLLLYTVLSLSSADLIVLFSSISTLMPPSIHRSLSSDGWVGDRFRHAFCSGYESPERDHDHHLRLRVPNRDTGESLDHLQTRPSQVNLSFFCFTVFIKSIVSPWYDWVKYFRLWSSSAAHLTVSQRSRIYICLLACSDLLLLLTLPFTASYNFKGTWIFGEIVSYSSPTIQKSSFYS